jgi:hypothetical protein
MTVLAGVHEQYQGTVDVTTPEHTLERYPKTAVTREFANGVITLQNIVPKLINLCQNVWDAGLTAAVSFKFSVADVLSGAWKPYIQSAAAWLRDNGHDDDTIFIIWHEPENDVPKYFTGAVQFVQYFNTVHDWVKAIAPSLLTAHAALGYRYADGIDIDDTKAAIWGKTKADIKGIDIYSGRSFPLGTILAELTGFKRWVTYVVGATASYAVFERGLMADTAAEYDLRATIIRREADWLRSDPVGKRCKVYIMWLTSGTENDVTLKPDAKMKDAVNYLLAKVTEPDPTPVPVEPAPATTTACPLCMGSGQVATGQTYTIVKVS